VADELVVTEKFGPTELTFTGEAASAALTLHQRHITSSRGRRTAVFFISYAGVDVAWAEWIAWQLEAAGHKTILQAWDFRAGAHFVDEMHRATQGTRTIAVLSQAYLGSAFAAEEWQAAWASDPAGRAGRLLVVRVEECDRPSFSPRRG
jgi:hypothetical protein